MISTSPNRELGEGQLMDGYSGLAINPHVVEIERWRPLVRIIATIR